MKSFCLSWFSLLYTRNKWMRWFIKNIQVIQMQTFYKQRKQYKTVIWSHMWKKYQVDLEGYMIFVPEVFILFHSFVGLICYCRVAQQLWIFTKSRCFLYQNYYSLYHFSSLFMEDIWHSFIHSCNNPIASLKTPVMSSLFSFVFLCFWEEESMIWTSGISNPVLT